MTRTDVRLLFALLGGAFAWTLHLLASYAVVAVGCARGWAAARPALIVVTLAALALTGAAAIVGERARARSSTLADTTRRTGQAPAIDAARFTLSVGGGLSALFAFLILLGGAVPFLTPLCAVTQ